MTFSWKDFYKGGICYHPLYYMQDSHWTRFILLLPLPPESVGSLTSEVALHEKQNSDGVVSGASTVQNNGTLMYWETANLDLYLVFQLLHWLMWSDPMMKADHQVDKTFTVLPELKGWSCSTVCASYLWAGKLMHRQLSCWTRFCKEPAVLLIIES